MSLGWNAPKYLFKTEEDCCDRHGCTTEFNMFLASDANSAERRCSPIFYLAGGLAVLSMFRLLYNMDCANQSLRSCSEDQCLS